MKAFFLASALLCAATAYADKPTSAVVFESPSADEFQSGVQARVLPANYRTDHYSFLFANSDELLWLSQHFGAFREFVASKVNGICLGMQRSTRTCERSSDSLKGNWIDVGTGEIAAREFALWFYKLDGENWFSHEKMLQESSAYLQRDNVQLFMARGFRSSGVLADGLVVEDLPVVVDFNEKTLSLWVNQLQD